MVKFYVGAHYVCASLGFLSTAFSRPLRQANAMRLINSKTFSASQIYELGEDKENTMDFAEAIDSSDLEEFGFTDSFIFELWGAITDAKSGRL